MTFPGLPSLVLRFLGAWLAMSIWTQRRLDLFGALRAFSFDAFRDLAELVAVLSPCADAENMNELHTGFREFGGLQAVTHRSLEMILGAEKVVSSDVEE